MTTKEVVHALKTVLPVVEKVPHSLGFHTVEMDGENLYAFNMIQGYRITFPSKIKGAFNPHAVLKVIESWPDNEVIFIQDEATLKIKCGRNSRSVALQDAHVIREFLTAENNEKDYFPLPENFMNTMKQAIIPGNKKLPGVIVNSGSVLSTNNVTIFMADLGTQTDPFRLSEQAIGIVSRHDVDAVKTSGVWIQFNLPDLGTFIARGYDLDGIPLDHFVPMIEKYKTAMPLVEFETTDAFTSALVAVNGLVQPETKINLTFAKEGITLDATAEDGQASTFVPIPLDVDEAFVVKVESSRITPFIKKGKAMVKFVAEKDKLYITISTKEYTFLVGTYR